jgi:hypothetical protein
MYYKLVKRIVVGTEHSRTRTHPFDESRIVHYALLLYR